MPLTFRTPAKVNLALSVGPVRPDGYHDLATVFQAVSIYDDITVDRAPGDRLVVTGPAAEGVPTDASNLVSKARALLTERYRVTEAAGIHLHKQIPAAGGMAGGSSDAAATILALDTWWGLGMSRDEMLDVAAELGSDVPFALVGHTAMGVGRGTELSPVLTSAGFHWVFAIAEFGLSTPEVFRAFDAANPTPQPPAVDVDLMLALRSGDPAALGRALSNDLQPAALALAPSLADTIAVALEAGAYGAIVSGSGPTVAALVKSNQHASAVAAQLIATGVAARAIPARGPVGPARMV